MATAAPGKTPKGRREAERILDAAIEALSRDGLQDTTLASIAALAAVDKRMVIYYFGSRDDLLVKVVQTVGERVAASVAEALEPITAPGPLADIGVDALWQTGLAAPALPRAYFALLHGTQSEQMREPLREITQGFYRLTDERIAAIETHGYRLTGDRGGFITLAFSTIRGLVIEWMEAGETPELAAALARFKAFVASQFILAD